VSSEFNRKFASVPARDIPPSETPSSSSERQAPPRTQLAQARVGAHVRVHGLQNSSEINNCLGTVKRAVDGGRFLVLLNGEGGQNLALKPENFSDAPGNAPLHPDFHAENLQTSLGASPYGPLVTGMRFVVFFMRNSAFWGPLTCCWMQTGSPLELPFKNASPAGEQRDTILHMLSVSWRNAEMAILL